MTSLNEGILTDALVLAQQQLQSFAQSEDFWSVFDSVFGTEYDRTQAEAIQQAWQANNFSLLPEIQVVDATSMPGIQAGFSAQTDKIYINADFLSNATADQIAAVLLEEIGHSVDSQINVNDTAGDEGEVFSASLRKIPITEEQLVAAKFEHDQTQVILNGEVVSLEMSVQGANKIINGNFETGNLSGWSIVSESGSNGSFYIQSGTSSPISGFSVPSPPGGSYAAMSDQTGPGSHVLFQNISLEAGLVHTLSFDYFIGNRYGAFVTPNTMSRFTSNQQFRVDILNPTFTNFFGTSTDGVLANIFQTVVGSALLSNYQPLTFNLTPFAGSSVKLAFRMVDTLFFFQAGIDNVAVNSVNVAPVLSDTNVALGSIGEDSGVPIGIVGTLVSQFVDIAGGTGQNNVTDTAPGAVTGIAIANINTTNGTWFYSINNGASWSTLEQVSESNARLLAADSNTRIYFQPNANFNGTIANAIQFRAWDRITGTNGGTANTSINGGSTSFSVAMDTASITVSPVNDVPVVSNTITDQTATEDSAFNFTIPANVFSDVDGDTLIYSATLADGSVLPSWLSFNAITRTFSGTPENGDVGTLSVKVIAADGLGTTAENIFTLAIANTNDDPVVSNAIANQNAVEDTLFSFTIPDGTFADVDGDSLTYTASLENGDPLPSWLVFNATTKTFSGTPVNGDVGTISVLVTASDGQAATSDVFELAIANINDDPVVSNAIATQDGEEDTAVTFKIPANTFSDVDAGDTLTLTATLGDGSTLPVWLSFDATTRTFSGTPPQDFNGTLSLKVTATDSGNLKTSSTFDLAIANINDAPTLTGTSATLVNGTEDTTYTINAADLLQGFSDVDTGDTLSVIDLTATNGNLINNNDGTYSFTPDANFNGTVNLAYNVVDSNGGSSAATQSFTVDAINDVPVGTASGDLLNSTEDTTYTINAADLLQGFSDVDGDTLFVSGLTATNGNLVNNNDTYTFTPAANFNGAVSLTYNVVDGNGGSVAATQSFTVDAVNDVPVGIASANLSTGTEDTTYTINAADLLAGFSDVDGDILSVADLIATNGALVDNNDGTYTFTPAANYNGSVNLSYNVIDGNGGTITAAQSITIAAVNDAPVVSNAIAAQNTLEDNLFTFTIPGDTFSDVDGDALTYTATLENGDALPTWLSFDGTTLSGTPTNDEVGNLNIEVMASDGELSVSNVFNLAIANTNDAPTATNDSLITSEDTPLVISATTLLGNDVDVDLGDILSVSEFIQPSQGGLVDNGNGTYTYTPNTNYNGGDSFAYTIRDRDGATSTATVNLTVNAVNDNPDAINDIVTARQGTAKTILATDLLANDADIEGDALRLTQVKNAQNGTVALDSNGNVVFTASANVKTASFEYTLSDGRGGIDTAVVNVLVGMTDDGGNGQDIMNGTAGDDVLNGGNGDDTLLGFAGDDMLLGSNGMDNLQGGEGKDWLYGGRGNDLLNGGLGSDTFVLISQNGTDTIQDFTDGVDRIGLAEGLTLGQFTVSASNGNTLIAKNNGEVLATLIGVNSSLITQADFITVV